MEATLANLASEGIHLVAYHEKTFVLINFFQETAFTPIQNFMSPFFCVFSRTLIFTQVSALKFHKLAKFHSKNLVLGMPAPYTTIIINIIQKDVDPPTHFRWDLLALKVLLGQSHVAKTFGKRHLGNLSKTT